MPKESAPLDRILSDITKAQQLLKSSVELVKTLGSTYSKDVDQDVHLEKTKNIIEELNLNINSVRECFNSYCDSLTRTKQSCSVMSNGINDKGTKESDKDDLNQQEDRSIGGENYNNGGGSSNSTCVDPFEAINDVVEESFCEQNEKCSDRSKETDDDNMINQVTVDNNLNKANYVESHSEGDCDPLHVDENLKSNDTTNNASGETTDETDIKPVFKIKCVDITKLIDTEKKLKVNNLNASMLNDSSVVIISDEENELSSKRGGKRNVDSIVKSLSRDVTISKVKSQRKVIVLDDSDSSEDNTMSRKKTKVESSRGSKPLRTIKRSCTVNIESGDKSATSTQRQLRKRPAPKSLANVSSLSENNSSSTNDHSDSSSYNRKTKKKSKSAILTKKGNVGKNPMSSDAKLSLECYVPLARIPAVKLKENYEKKYEKDEIRMLTNLDNLKKSQKVRSDTPNSIKSDGTKKRESSHPKQNKKGEENYEACASDTSMRSEGAMREDMFDSPIIKDTQMEAKKTETNLKEAETIIAEAILDDIRSNSNKSDINSDPEANDKSEEPEKLTEKEQELATDKKLEKEKQLEEDKEKREGEREREKQNEPEKDKERDPENEKENGAEREKETESEKEEENPDSSITEKGNEADKKDDSSDEEQQQKKKWRKDKRLCENITESDSDENFAKFMKKKSTMKEKDSDDEGIVQKKSTKRLKKKAGKCVLGSSDSDSASNKRESDASEQKSSESDSNAEEETENKKPSRRRIKRLKDSSDEDGANKSTRKQIRKVLARDSLEASTIAAEKEEQERKARIVEKQKKYNEMFASDSLEKATVDKIVLDFDDKTKEELLKVDERLVIHLKPHQAKGVQFMWDTCFESMERAKTTKGSGCILAHCMGLGKTLQVITLIHTLILNEEKLGIRKILVVCPLSTVLNWVAEFKKWLPEDEVEVFELVSLKQNTERMYQVKEWDRVGGALVLGYDMFRNLTNPVNKRLSKKIRGVFQTCLVDPGPDLVICDEGHLLKNEKTSLSMAMNRLRTMRRVVLTGTPLQNNLKEYWCMVQFVKPNLLGTFKEYLNRFVNPITNGQYTDSTQHDINIMRKRSHVLHKLLDGVVQRRDYSVLAPFLPPKFEYVLFVSLTEKQIKLYERYKTEKSGRRNEDGGRTRLFADFNEFQRICTHPRVLLDKSIELKQARDKLDLLDDDSEGSLKDFLDDESEKSSAQSSSNSSGSDSESGGSHKGKSKSAPKQRITRSTAATYAISEDEQETADAEPDPLEWWREFCTDEDLDNICHGGKLSLLFEILKQCEIIGDKILIFSQSLYSLNIIEYFLNKIDDATQNSETHSFCGFSGSWSLGLDYFRLDGSSSCDNRAAWCKTFNDPENIRARLFLISTRAGGLGINLVAANRVIIFDVSWNPSHDTQSIYRVYRFGQTKPSYIYRFVTLGTMEMKVYERQVTKQAISKRVIDEQQIDRHYNQNDLAELYRFEPIPEENRPIPLVPKDVLLGELLQADNKIYKYHEHQSLLENKVDEVLNEEERKAAWEEFESEKKARKYSGSIGGYPIHMILTALQNMTHKENPSWTVEMINEKIAVLLEQIQEEAQVGISPLMTRVAVEIRAAQASQQAAMAQYMKMLQHQQQQMLMAQYRMGLMNTQSGMSGMRPTVAGRNTSRMPNPASAAMQRGSLVDNPMARLMMQQQQNPVDFIDLND